MAALKSASISCLMMNTTVSKPARRASKMRIVDDELAVAAHRVDLLEAAVAAAHAGGHNNEYRFVHCVILLFAPILVSKGGRGSALVAVGVHALPFPAGAHTSLQCRTRPSQPSSSRALAGSA